MNLTRTQVEDARRSTEAYLCHGATLTEEAQAQTILDLSKDWLELDQALRPSSVELPVEFIVGWECQREACFQFTPFTECEKDESGRSIPPPYCPECGSPPRPKPNPGLHRDWKVENPLREASLEIRKPLSAIEKIIVRAEGAPLSIEGLECQECGAFIPLASLCTSPEHGGPVMPRTCPECGE